MQNENVDSFSSLWQAYVMTLRDLVIVRQRKPSRIFLHSFEPFFNKTFEFVLDGSTAKNLKRAWLKFEEVESNQRISQLLRLEMAAFINGFEEVTGSSPRSKKKPPATRKWNSRAATAKDMLRAGKTLLESLLDALKDILSPTIRGLLNTLKEVLEIAAG